MRKRIICAGMAIFGFCVANGQVNSASNPFETVSEPSDISIDIPFSRQNEYDLPKKAELEGWANEKKIYTVSVRNHRLQDAWQSWYYNGKCLDSGKLINGVPDGEWKVWDSTGQLIAVRHYDADKLRRIKEEMRLNHPRNSFYSLTALYKNNRDAARRYLQAGYSFSFAGKRKKQSTLQQVVEQNINDSPSYQPVFEECLHHGVYKNYFTGGLTRDSGYYKDGLKEGLWIHRNSPDGSWYTGAYKNGMRQYEWKQFDASGRLILLIFYNRMGEEEGRKKFGQ